MRPASVMLSDHSPRPIQVFHSGSPMTSTYQISTGRTIPPRATSSQRQSTCPPTWALSTWSTSKREGAGYILNICLKNRPTIINRCKILPGISEHETVLTVAEVEARFQKPVARVLCPWDKGNLNQVKRDLLSFSQAFVSENTVTSCG